jgi:hypothetical protein
MQTPSKQHDMDALDATVSKKDVTVKAVSGSSPMADHIIPDEAGAEQRNEPRYRGG